MTEGQRPRVEDLMVKTAEVAHVHETLAAAAARMAAIGIEALPVVDGDQLRGTISLDDILRHGREHRRARGDLLIGDVVGQGIFHCYTGQSAAEVAGAMAAMGVSHLAVLDADKALVGIVAKDDLPPPARPPGTRFTSVEGSAPARDPPPGLKVCSEKPELKE